jgi:hypothetical protein
MSRRKRIADIEALIRRDDHVPVDMQPLIDALMASAMANYEGRPYSHWSNPLRPPAGS